MAAKCTTVHVLSACLAALVWPTAIRAGEESVPVSQKPAP